MKKLVTFLGLVFSLFLSAQTVQLEKTFGNSNGFEILDGETTGASFIRSLILPDGKILISGNRINGTNLAENFIAKFNPNGQIDTSFGTNGFLIVDHLDDNGCELLFADNHIFAFFNVYKDCIMKFDLNGNLDTSFGNSGRVDFNDGEHLSDLNIAFQDGNYLYVEFYEPVVKIKRFDIKTGVIDLTYGINGEVILPFTNVDDDYMIKTSDNKILIATMNWYNLTLSLYKFNMGGSLDTSFGNNGAVTLYFENRNANYSISEFDGSIITAMTNGDDASTTLYKNYTSNGQPVTSFGNNGTVSLKNVLVSEVKIFSNKIYLSGANENYDLALWRFNADGSFDTSFNKTGGYIESSHTGWAESFDINSDGSIITAGEYPSSPSTNINYDENNKIFLAKYLVDESLATEDLSPKAKVALYPNPVKDVLYFSASGKVAKAEIYDLNGRLVKTAAVSNNSVNVSSLSKDVYFIILHTDKGVIKEKFIKN